MIDPFSILVRLLGLFVGVVLGFWLALKGYLPKRLLRCPLPLIVVE